MSIEAAAEKRKTRRAELSIWLLFGPEAVCLMLAAATVATLITHGVYEDVARGPAEIIRINRFTGNGWVFQRDASGAGQWYPIQEPVSP